MFLAGCDEGGASTSQATAAPSVSATTTAASSAPECRGAILDTTRAPLGSGFAGVIRAIVAGIEIRLDPKGAPVATVERDGERLPFSLPASPAPPDFTPTVAAAIKKGGAATRVVVRADKSVPHATVIGLLDALKQQGVTHIAFGTLPAH